jgi:hypothetical protein
VRIFTKDLSEISLRSNIQSKSKGDSKCSYTRLCGYLSHHPEKSLAIMESLLSINQVIDYSVKLGIFLDTDSSFILNNEVSVPFFLGEARFVQEFTRENELPMFIQNLAKADFGRIKSLADKFEKTEFKMTAKLLILESLLGKSLQFGRGSYTDRDY